MIKGIESITLFSENAKKLANFYKDKVGLEVILEAEMGENNEELYGFKMGSSGFYIVDHSEVSGLAKEPKRVIINFEVDDIKADAKKLEEAGVKKTQDVYHVEDYGYIATFEDIDGNFFQIVQVKGS